MGKKSSLDKKKRGTIESLLDEALKEQEEIIAEIEWVRKEIPISSFGDFVLGYTLGALKIVATVCASVPFVSVKKFSWERTEKDRIIDAILKRRLPEIVEKINRELNV